MTILKYIKQLQKSPAAAASLYLMSRENTRMECEGTEIRIFSKMFDEKPEFVYYTNMGMTNNMILTLFGGLRGLMDVLKDGEPPIEGTSGVGMVTALIPRDGLAPGWYLSLSPMHATAGKKVEGEVVFEITSDWESFVSIDFPEKRHNFTDEDENFDRSVEMMSDILTYVAAGVEVDIEAKDMDDE